MSLSRKMRRAASMNNWKTANKQNNAFVNNATINAGAVNFEANGNIKEAEDATANSIICDSENGGIKQINNEDVTIPTLQITTHNGNVGLNKTNLTATKGGIFVEAEKGSVTLDEVTAGFREGCDSDQDTDYNNVNVDLGGEDKEIVSDTKGGNNEGMLHIAVNEKGEFFLVSEEGNVNSADTANVSGLNEDKEQEEKKEGLLARSQNSKEKAKNVLKSLIARR